VTVHFPRLALLAQIIARVRRMFDLAADPAAINAVLSRDRALAPLIAARPGLRTPGCWSGFEVAVRAILGQQISVPAAIRLAGRLAAELGPALSEPVAGLARAFPGPEHFTAEATAGLPMPRARSAAIAGLAAAAGADPRLFTPRGDLDEAVAQLKALPGVGEWTAQYIAMRALRESDAFLAADIGLQRSLAALEGTERPSAKALLARAEAWRPWRAYAALHLWMAETADTQAPMGEDNEIAA
jgi:AraC family transcriptional regulator of adaptative response / DNA-3-methyladenine glycosylase II